MLFKLIVFANYLEGFRKMKFSLFEDNNNDVACSISYMRRTMNVFRRTRSAVVRARRFNARLHNDA